MGILHEELAATLPHGMSMPKPLALLYDWIETRGQFNSLSGQRNGYLYPLLPDRKDYGGTWVEFRAQGYPEGYYFGPNERVAANRVRVFAQVGGEGSMAALWLDDDGNTRIVHLGSGSGSTMMCVLADDAIDFLRLCAIGYEELCWGEEFDAAPRVDDAALVTWPNMPFRTWVETTFSTTIPTLGTEIVRYPNATLDSSTSDDLFWQWCMGTIS